MMKRVKGVVHNERKHTWNVFYRVGKTRTSKLLGKDNEISEQEAWRRALVFLEDEGRKRWTVQRVTDEYLKRTIGPLTSISKKVNSDYLLRRLCQEFGSTVFEELNAGEVEDWFVSLALAPRSKGELKQQFSHLWKFARKRGMVSRALVNPMEDVDIPDVSEITNPTESMTTDTFLMFVKCLIEPFATFAYISISHGLRLSECLALKWKDINWASRKIWIRRTIVKSVVRDKTKTKGSRTELEMDDALIEQLEIWKLNAQFSQPEDWVFANRRGDRPLHQNTIRVYYRKAARQIGWERANTHVMRHSHRSWMDLGGVPPKIQQLAMRHKRLPTTMDVYGMNLNPGAVAKAQKLVTKMAFGRQVISPDFTGS